jgi:hypothetical protein
MTVTRNISQAAQGPRIRITGGPIADVSDESLISDGAPPETHYVYVEHNRTVVVDELSKMEQILEYLKALYR